MKISQCFIVMLSLFRRQNYLHHVASSCRLLFTRYALDFTYYERNEEERPSNPEWSIIMACLDVTKKFSLTIVRHQVVGHQLTGTIREQAIAHIISLRLDVSAHFIKKKLALIK